MPRSGIFYSLLCLVFVACPTLSSAGVLLSNGTFATDDGIVLTNFTLSSAQLVTIKTTSFADGSVGFEPVLTLYDAAGNLLLQDATGGTTPGGCNGRAIDAVSGYCLDALIQAILNPGSYTVALTEWDNIPGGPTLADGFPQTGNGNFTGPQFRGSAGSFILFDGSQRTNAWALSIANVDVPEPSTAALVAFSMLLGAAAIRRRKTGLSR